jgi:hypothetical protein
MEFKARWCKPNNKSRAAVIEARRGAECARYIAGDLSVGLGGRFEGSKSLERAVLVYAELFLGCQIYVRPGPSARCFVPE